MDMAVIGHDVECSDVEFAPRYDLSDEEIRELTADFLDNAEPTDGKYLCMNFKPDDPISNVGRTVERKVFEDSFENDSQVMTKEYGDYEAASQFFMVFDREARAPVGVLRTISNSDAGLKTLNDINAAFGYKPIESLKEIHHLDDLNSCWDIGTLAVLPEYRGKKSEYKASTLLYRALFIMAEHDKIHHMVTMIDAGARRGIKLLGIPFIDIENTEPIEYLGSGSTYPMYGDVTKFRESVTAKVRELTSTENHARAIGNTAVALFVRKILGNKPQEQRPTTIRKEIFRHQAGLIVSQLATGQGLDGQIQLNIF